MVQTFIFLLIFTMSAISMGKPQKPEVDLCDQLAHFSCNLKPGTQVADDTGSGFSGNPMGDVDTFEMAKNQIARGLGSEIEKLINSWKDTGALTEQMTELGFKDSCAATDPDTAFCMRKFRTHVKRVAVDEMLVGPVGKKEKDQNAIYHLWNDPEYQGLRERYKNAGINPSDAKNYNAALKPWFNEVKAEIKESIKENFTGETETKLQEKIDAVKFGGTDCRAGKTASIFDYIANNAQFDPRTNEVKICAGFAARGNSAYSLIQVLGHELGHAVDPCNSVSRFKATASSPPVKKNQLAYPELVKCLERKTSIGAKALPNPDDPKDKAIDYCNHQVTEAFSDWMGIEVLGRMHAKGKIGGADPMSLFWGLTNSFRGGCESTKKRKGLDVHPETVERISKLLAVHPYFRKNLGCRPAPKTEYCNPKQYSPAFLHLQAPEMQPARD